MIWVITLCLWAAKLDRKEEIDVAQVDRLGWEQLKCWKMAQDDELGRGVHLVFARKLNLCEIGHPAGVMLMEVGASLL